MAFEGMDFSILNRVPQIDVAGSMGKGLQLRDMMQARKDDDAMRELSRQAGGDLGQLADLAQQKGLYKQAQAVRKQQLDTQKEIVTIQETLGKVDKQRRDAIQAANEDVGKMAAWADTPEKWAQGMQVVMRDHPIIAQGLQPFLQFNQDNRKAVLTRAATVDAALKTLKPEIQDRNGALVPVTTDITGQQTVGAPVGFKAQSEPAKVGQDLSNGLITPGVAADLTKKVTTHAPGVTVNTGEKLPPGWRQDPANPGAWKPIPGGPHDTNSKDKPLTEAQGNALGFGIRAREADVILNKLEAQGANVAGGLQRVASSVPGVGNYLTPPSLQEYDQAKRNFVSAVLRKESGAAISASEFANEEKKYFPQPGDSPEVIRQKADARKTAIGVLQIQAGRDLPEIVRPVKAAKPGKPASASGKATFAEIREAVKPGGKYAGKTVDEVVFALRQRGIEVQ
jgi:hypothetical protein